VALVVVLVTAEVKASNTGRCRVRDDVPMVEHDRPAVTVAGRCLRRGELLAAAGAVADRVAGAPVVAVESAASLETVVAVLGVLLSGAALVPVPPDSGPREREHILTDSGAALRLGGAGGIPVDTRARSSRAWRIPTDGTALIMYTSGTTGAPKGVVLSHRAIAAGLDGLAEAWAWTPDDLLVHGLPLFHVHGLILGVLGALRVGSPLVHTGRPAPAAYAAAGGTLYFGVPTVWGRVAAEPSCARALSSARLLVSGSAGLPGPVFDGLVAQAGQGPIERYGMTETLITLATRADGARSPGWVGTPITAVQARVLDDDEAPVPADGETIGHLQVRGATLFDGYLGRPEATAAASTVDGWFATGDSATVAADGRHRILGRTASDLISCGGYRIGAGEVEAALLCHPDVREAAVVGEPDDDLGQRVVAYVVTTGPTGSAQGLIDFVATELSVHKRPREVRFVDGLPRNAMGKILKSALT
jgi:fatty acid CoA ligase FadD36